jgi:mRNA-degrading endonuclease RelE of RelBE toxin-antitoxin system
MAVKVITTPDFDKLIKTLRKKYPNVLKDLAPLIEQLKNGETPGDKLQRVAGYETFKVRVPNRDAQRGKSGGYRVIYYVRSANTVYLLEIYSKSEFEDVPDLQVIAAIEEILTIADNDDDAVKDDSNDPPSENDIRT